MSVAAAGTDSDDLLMCCLTYLSVILLFVSFHQQVGTSRAGASVYLALCCILTPGRGLESYKTPNKCPLEREGHTGAFLDLDSGGGSATVACVVTWVYFSGSPVYTDDNLASSQSRVSFPELCMSCPGKETEHRVLGQQ